MSQHQESREDKFRRLAEARVNKILHLYRLLGNLSWTGTYAYTKDQVDQIFTTLQAELLRVKLRFLRTQSTAKKRFVLSEPYTPERFKISEDNPTLAIPLPDGTYLRAVGYPTDTYPCIDIYWDNGINAPTDTLCFVEFNPDHEEDEGVCIGAYRNNQDDPTYYAPYMAAERNAKGLIVPRFGKKPENHVAVGMTWDALAELLLITKTHYEAWLAAWYLSQIQAANPQPPAKTRKAPEIPAQQPEPAIQSQYVMPEYSGKSLF